MTSNIPLPEKLRPKTLKDYVGQDHLIGKGKIIRVLLEKNKAPNKAGGDVGFPSLIFWGPPGSGKTTLARIIASHLNRPFHEFSAVSTSVKDVEKVIQKDSLFPPLVFIDEIHRFNKAQQDRLLPHVERGDILLIGATTENPSFEVISPLLSRCRVLVLNKHSEKELSKIINKATKSLNIKIDPKAKKFLKQAANGDARVVLNVIEIAHLLAPERSDGGQASVNIHTVEQALQRRQLNFDKKGEEFYNVISAFIKSMRASQTDSALYYLARMIEAGQDPLYVARRMIVFASEDIGMAQPTALVVANEVFRSCQIIGYPECAINLAHGVVYLSEAKKDRKSYDALRTAQADVKKYGNLPIPKNILNAPTKLMKEIGYGKGYEKYDKNSYLPKKLKGKKYYNK